MASRYFTNISGSKLKAFFLFGIVDGVNWVGNNGMMNVEIGEDRGGMKVKERWDEGKGEVEVRMGGWVWDDALHNEEDL